jgi:hypothetical protein
MRKLRVYVAGPISKGDLGSNLRMALDAANELIRVGLYPYVPHLSILWGLVDPPDGASMTEARGWLPYNFGWLEVCDVLLRLPGESVGAAEEVHWAKKHGIPVFYSITGVRAWAEQQDRDPEEAYWDYIRVHGVPQA